MRKQIMIAGTFISMMLCCSLDPTAPAASKGSLPSVEAITPMFIGDQVVGATAAVAPAVQVKDGKTGRPLAGVKVSFYPVGGGAASNTSVVTGEDGIASAGQWQYRTTPGVSELAVWVNGGPRLTFRATVKPDVPAMLFEDGQLEIMGVVGARIPIIVAVKDRFANYVPKVEVTFHVVDGGGTARETIITDQFGRAVMPDWTLGPSPGMNTLSVGVSGVEMLVLHAFGADPATVKWFVLDSLLSGDSPMDPQAIGISEARVGFLTPDCMCMAARGLFIRTVKYADGRVLNWSGTYKLEGKTLTTPAWAWSDGFIDANRLVLYAPDRWEEDSSLTWIYKAVDASAP